MYYKSNFIAHGRDRTIRNENESKKRQETIKTNHMHMGTMHMGMQALG